MIDPEVIVIDAEGMDWTILRDLSLTDSRPNIIYFEKGDLSGWDSEVIERFAYNGYKFNELNNNAVFIKSEVL